MVDPPASPSPASARTDAAVVVDLDEERRALDEARRAVQDKIAKLATIDGGGADALADEYISSVVVGAVERMQQDLVVFGRVDDDRPWRVGLYGIDRRGDQLVVDWRAPFAERFYQARFDEPHGLARRVSYVGCIDDLFIEDFVTGEVAGSSPLLGELARHRSSTMRAAVATLQSEQDDLVRRDPRDRLVLRGGPGTGKTVVGLHRAAWLVYNDQRITADRILVVGPSDRFLRFVASVLPTLGEARVMQTTFERLLGPSAPVGGDERWVPLIDAFEASLLAPAAVKVGWRTIPLEEVAELVDRLATRPLPWRDRRKVFVSSLAARYELKQGDVSKAVADVWPTCTTNQALARLRRRPVLEALAASTGSVDAAFIDDWLAAPGDGGVRDELRARFEGVPARYSHVIVDEAQDLTLLQLRAVMRRADGVTLVGDDAQRSNPGSIGLRRAATLLEVDLEQMTTAYRMSAEIADWLNVHAERHGIDGVTLVGIRPTGVAVRDRSTTTADGDALLADLEARWPNVAEIRAGEVWDHKGVEYDAVLVRAAGMTPSEVYLAASRAAHELVVLRED
jgi:DNA helicase IV